MVALFESGIRVELPDSPFIANLLSVQYGAPDEFAPKEFQAAPDVTPEEAIHIGELVLDSQTGE